MIVHFSSPCTATLLDWPVLTACPSSPLPSLELDVIRPLYQSWSCQVTTRSLNPADTLQPSSHWVTRQHLTHLMVPSFSKSLCTWPWWVTLSCCFSDSNHSLNIGPCTQSWDPVSNHVHFYSEVSCLMASHGSSQVSISSLHTSPYSRRRPLPLAWLLFVCVKGISDLTHPKPDSWFFHQTYFSQSF